MAVAIIVLSEEKTVGVDSRAPLLGESGIYADLYRNMLLPAGKVVL